jgi:Late embryogenesis abundant protein
VIVRFARALPVFCLAASLAALASCTVWKKPVISFDGISLHGMNQNGASLEVRLRVDNPNSYRLVVKHFTYRLTLGGTPVGGGETDSDVAVEAKSGSEVALPVALDWRELKGRGLDFLLSGGVDYAIDGEITFSTPIGTFERPYGHSGRISPSRFLRVVRRSGVFGRRRRRRWRSVRRRPRGLLA